MKDEHRPVAPGSGAPAPSLQSTAGQLPPVSPVWQEKPDKHSNSSRNALFRISHLSLQTCPSPKGFVLNFNAITG